MINAILNYLNNYFEDYDYIYQVDATFTSNDTITGIFTDTLLAGEWFKLSGTRLNDGIYLISEIDDDTITIDTTYDKTISTESEVEDATFIKVAIPSELVALTATINTYNSNAQDGIASESQGSRSVTYASGGSSWMDVFASKLSQWRKLRW